MPKGIPGSGKAKTIKTKAAKIKAPRSVRAPGVRKIKMTAANKNDGKYQCVLVGDTWHSIQSQSSPPSVRDAGAWTLCVLWATFKRGYTDRRPDCLECLKHTEEYEKKKNEDGEI
jgi:hypothetical protein